ncbi:MAG: hypothetical protein IJI46_08335 [Erysipelotrichaceae bacterium]|nr:hypothetical protein [Erysipelotrichaceae bacterium]
MKKYLIKFLVLIMIFSGFSYAIFHDHEQEDEHDHLFHVHVYEVEAATAKCPWCGNTLTVIEIEGMGPTCTSSGWGIVECNNTDAHVEQDNSVYQNEVQIPALGHDYNAATLVAATCTAEGTIRYTCSRCGDHYDSATAALGHNYTSKITKEATCTEDGVRTYTCTRCNDKYTKKIEALGHDMEYDELEPTCTQQGHRIGTCTRGDKETKIIFPALGHDLDDPKVIKEPTCTAEGTQEAVCKRCNETVTEAIAALGHDYPSEWTLEREASYTQEGIEYKLCKRCGDRIEQLIPKLDPTKIIVTGGGLAAVAGAGALWALKARKKRLKKSPKKVLEKVKLSFEDKTIVYCGSDEELLKKLKSKRFLAISNCEYEELETCVEENGPDLIILDVDSDETLADLETKKEGEVLADQTWAYVCSEEYLRQNKDKLKEMVKEKQIVGFAQSGSNPDVMMVKLVLPVIKPDMKTDEQLGNIGAIADALGIPVVSTVIDVYVAGRDIKSTLESDEIGVSETATIISDIASILGYDTVASVAGLVDDVDSIKAAIDEEAGANEHRYGVDGAKDIVEVVSDLVNKD